MKRSMHFLGNAFVLAGILGLAASAGQAGRSGGALSTFSTAPAGTSIPFDLAFDAGQPAVIVIESNGQAVMDVRLSDADGHVAVGTGPSNRKTVTMNVYRAGMFHVEVRNLGSQQMIFTLSTN